MKEHQQKRISEMVIHTQIMLTTLILILAVACGSTVSNDQRSVSSVNSDATRSPDANVGSGIDGSSSDAASSSEDGGTSSDVNDHSDLDAAPSPCCSGGDSVDGFPGFQCCTFGEGGATHCVADFTPNNSEMCIGPPMLH